jgi:hypothetical protein
MNTEILRSREDSSRLTPLVNVLEWTLILLVAYMQWAGDSAPPLVVGIATAGWIVIAMLCVALLTVSVLTDGRSGASEPGMSTAYRLSDGRRDR